MYPTKSVLDFMAEMNRFSRTGGVESDMFQSTPLARTSSLNQSMAQSSSSTETSPDSFPDLTPHQFPPEEARKPDLYHMRNANWRQEQYENQFRTEHYDSFRSDAFEARLRPEHAFVSHNRFESRLNPEMYRNQHPDTNNLVVADHIYETPLIVRRQRPIMGRKIMATTEAPLKTIDEFSIWQTNMPHTPPKSFEHNTSNIYELFPSENRGFEFPSPVKSPSHQFRPSQVPLSPKTSTPSVTPPPRSPFSSRTSTPFKEPLIGPSTSFTSYDSSKMCTFCRKNGETPLVYMTHTVKEKMGNKNVVTCPILRSHVCSMCGASGDNAHTITYCPVLRSGNNGQPLQSTTITLKNTRVKSNGRRRY